jgi:cytochrome c oxidase subunit 2
MKAQHVILSAAKNLSSIAGQAGDASEYLSMTNGRIFRSFCRLTGLAAVLLCGGYGPHSSLDSAGPQAGRIEALWWLFFWVSVVVWVLVMAFLLVPVLRRRGKGAVAADEPVTKPEPAPERRRQLVVGGAVGVTTLVLFVLLFGDMVTGRAIHSLDDPNPLTIKINARQWWWEVQYNDALPSNIVTTANEIHIPVGRPVKFELQSNDVIHSFWVPNLHGKKDVVPGHPISTWLKADREGEFYGQCAEFCGVQHANMRMLVVAEPQEKFDAWLAAQRLPAPAPVYEQQVKGQQVFMASACVMCHTIGGTTAGGRVGPNLTHVAGRKILAAGALPNTPGHLAGWVIDPQRIKPGTRMPQNQLTPEELRALLEYLQTLK